MNITELIVFIIYLLFMIGIGVYFFLRSKGANEKDYFLGGRNMGAWVSALSAGASDMSAWVLMGLPASIYAAGIGQTWIAIGLAIGYTISWLVEAPRLRRYSIAAKDSITIPQYLTNRFLSSSKALQVICAVIFLVAYTIYAASSVKACGTLFNTEVGIDANVAMYLAAAIIIGYTFLGGFNAVCWTDFFQGMLMLAALMLVPILAVAMMQMADFSAPETVLPENYYNVLSSGKGDWKSFSDIISGLGWGLGYFGMPHILIRYFSVKSEKEMNKSRIIGCTWLLVILIATCVVGLIGRRFIGDALTGKSQKLNLYRYIHTVQKIQVKSGSFLHPDILINN